MKFRREIAFILAILFVGGEAVASKLSAPVELSMRALSPLALGEVRVVLEVEPLIDIADAVVTVRVPEGVVLVSEGEVKIPQLLRGETTLVEVVVRVEREGAHRLLGGIRFDLGSRGSRAAGVALELQVGQRLAPAAKAAPIKLNHEGRPVLEHR